MTIRPVSSVSLVKTYNQLNFEGKKKKHSNNGHSSNPVSHKLAVPLAATVLAMSPMASSSANDIQVPIDNGNSIEMNDSGVEKGRLVGQETFIDVESPSLYISSTIGLVNTKDNSKNFDKIMYGVSSMVDMGGFLKTSSSEKLVTDYSDITYDLISDDGTKGLSFNVKSINVDGQTRPIFDKEKVAYVESAIKSPNNKADIAVHKENRSLRHDQISMQNVANYNIMKDAIPKKSYGKLAGSQEVTIGNDKYWLGYYSTDDNMNDAEMVTIKKNDNPELWVRDVTLYNATINPKSSNPLKIKYSLVTLEGGDRTYALIDDQLANILIQVFNNDQFKNAAKLSGVWQVNSEYMTTTKGALMPMSEVE